MLTRPAVVAAVSLCIGIALRATSPGLDVTAPVTGTIGAILCLVVARMSERGAVMPRGRTMRLAAAVSLFATVGFLRLGDRIEARDAFRNQVATADVTTGVVRGPLVDRGWSTGFRLVVHGGSGVRSIRLSVSGEALEAMQQDTDPTDSSRTPCLTDGATLDLLGPLDITVTRRNPADFDYGAFLFARGYAGATRISDPRKISCTTMTGAVPALRARLAADISLNMSSDSAPLMQALLLGDRSHIGEDVRNDLARAGLMHLLAVSGLHVLLAGLTVHRLLFSALVRARISWKASEWIRVPTTICILVLYAILTGSAPSVVRAVIMAALMIARTLVRRNTDTLNTLGVAAVFVLFVCPEQLFDVGFQLSFAAVGGIVVLAGPLSESTRSTSRRSHLVRSSIAVSTAATLSTGPILAHNFGFVPHGGILLNVVAVPAASVALASGLLMLVATQISTPVALLFAGSADVAIRLVSELASRTVADLPFLAVDMPGTAGPIVGSGALVVVVAVHVRGLNRRWRITVGAALACAALAWTPVVESLGPARSLEAVFLDVGQGDGIVIRTPDRRLIVVDTGPAGGPSTAASRSLVPLIRRLGAKRIDALVITHPHADHDGGLADIASLLDIRLMISNGATTPANAQSLRGYAGDSVRVGSHVVLHILSPPRPNLGGPGSDVNANNASIVMRLDYGSTCILLTGDMEREAESILLGSGYDIGCDIVKVAHHGSRTSSTWPFVKAADTEGGFAVISVGLNNRFGLPDEEVVARWRATGSKVLRTDSGAKWFSSDGRHTSLRRWR